MYTATLKSYGRGYVPRSCMRQCVKSVQNSRLHTQVNMLELPCRRNWQSQLLQQVGAWSKCECVCVRVCEAADLEAGITVYVQSLHPFAVQHTLEWGSQTNHTNNYALCIS